MLDLISSNIVVFSNLLVVETFERDDAENGVIFVSGISSINIWFVVMAVFLRAQSPNESALLKEHN